MIIKVSIFIYRWVTKLKNSIKLIYILISLGFLGLGILGAILPFLPTTPFILISSHFALKGSKRLDESIKSSKLYQKHVASLMSKRAMTLKSKISILSFATFMLCIPLFITDSMLLRIFILIIMVVKYATFIFWIDTIEAVSIEYD